MALAVDGIPVSGSTGANTYSRNRYGAYRRRRVKPVNPNSLAQQSARSAFRAAVNSWTATLTPTERSSWETYAAAVPWLNKAGETVRLTGQAAYIRAFCAFAGQYNSTVPATAPAIFNIGSILMYLTSVTYDVSANTLGMVASAPLLDNTWQVEDGGINLFCYAPSNASRNFRPSLKKAWNAFVAGAVPASPITVAPFASPYVYQPGQHVWIGARGIHPDGRVTAEQLLGPVVVTVVP